MTPGTGGPLSVSRAQDVGMAQEEKSTSPSKKEGHREGRGWRDMGLVVGQSRMSGSCPESMVPAPGLADTSTDTDVLTTNLYGL